VGLAVLAVLSLGGVFGVSPQVVAAATATPPATSGNVSITPHQSDETLREYWTPERMASARNADNLEAGAPAAESRSAQTTSAGEPVSVPGATGSLGADPNGGAQNYASQIQGPYTNLPYRTNGKIFFRKASGGDFVCSGTLVNNPRQNLVITAGHCVHGGKNGSFHTNWSFVPGYDGSSPFNSNPYGSFGAFRLSTRTEWINNSNNRQDIGVAILNNQSNGQPLGARIGGQGIRFSQSASQTFTDFGYPASPPFNGATQWQCVSTLRGRDAAMPGAGPEPLRIQCDMTGGSSGGGWLINIASNGLGFVNSVNSYGYPNTDVGFEYGPYFGTEAQSLYDSNKNLGPGSK
jgi:V8-like Glu-specific endopeptidase